MTNHHVIDGAEEVTVAVGKRNEDYDAKIIGFDKSTDIAVLKIDAKDLPVAQLGDSDTLKEGDLVFAIGSPFGLKEQSQQASSVRLVAPTSVSLVLPDTRTSFRLAPRLILVIQAGHSLTIGDGSLGSTPPFSHEVGEM